VAAAEEAVRDGALRDGPPLPAPLFLGWEAENAHPTCIPLEEGPPGVVVPIAPTVARTLRRLAAAGPAQREAVIQELLRALAVEGLPPGMDAMTVAAVEPRERLVLRALPCGRALASHCEETATALRAFRESGGTADRAPCNGAANAAAARDFGPAPGRFWGVASALLADLLPPARSDAADPLTLGESLAVSVLVRQVEETDAWTARRERLLALAGRLLALPLDAAPPPADPGRGGRRRATAPSRAITALVDVLAAALPADESLLPDAALTHADTLLTALADGAGGPDLEAAAPVLRRVLAFARRELLPGEPSPADAGRGLWRTAAAVRALSRLGRAGPGDQAFHAVLRIAARMLGEPAAGAPLGDDVRLPPLVLPFGPVPLPAPGVYGRFDAEGNASAWVRSDEPLLPILFEALVAYQRPTSEALELLLLAATAPARVGHRRDAVIAALGSDDLSPERIRVRAAAADAFLRLFRRDASGRDAGDRLDRFEGIARWFLPLTAVEKGPAEEPVFALGLSAATPIAASPASPVPAFESVRDALVACVARPREDPADVARWEAMTPQDRTLYCQKHVEPWASDWARELRTVAVERRNIRDRRCWDHMQEEHRLRFEYCVDVENNREPQADLALGTEECRKVREEDESHADCLDLRYRPEFTTRGRPTVWGCYHRFPWLRDREPIGPDCPHLFQRLLAARMFVGFRTLAGAAAVDGIDADKLDALLPFESVIDVLREPERLDDETTLAALAAWAKALSEVEADVPAFRAPSRTSDAIAARDVPGREGAAPPAFVPAAWYEHPDWVERRTVSFSALWTDFLAACAPGAEADACAAGGGELRALLRRTGDDGAPGPFARLAAGTARVVEEGRLADALRSVAALRESDRCGSIPDILAACAARSVFAEPRPDDPVDRLLRRRSLHLLIGLAAEGTAAAAEAICRAAREFDRLPADLRPAARLAWYRIRPACAGAAIE
jgi:hypothetical protein